MKFIQEYKVSTKKNLASIGQKYYDADHDIMHYRMFYSMLMESWWKTQQEAMSRFMIHSSLNWLTKQCSICCRVKMELFRWIFNSQSRLDEYFDDDFICEIE